MLDASGSMTPDKMSAARSAIDRFVYDLLGADDELFFLEFANRPELVQEWTTDRRAISRAVARVRPAGGTAMYDAVADAVPLASIGKHPKKAMLVISDGNDTNSRVGLGSSDRLIRESEVLVYALGVDGTAVQPVRSRESEPPFPGSPFPLPGRRPQRPTPPIFGVVRRAPTSERVNAEALRRITDDTGGRTEIVRGFGDLDGATARIADELSKQYYLGYASPGKKDGRWHEIRVEVKGRRFDRARATGVCRVIIAARVDLPHRARAEPGRRSRRFARRLRRPPHQGHRPHEADSLAGQLRGRRAAWRVDAGAAADGPRNSFRSPRVFAHAAAGHPAVLRPRKAGALAPLPHPRLRSAREQRVSRCSSATRSTTSWTAPSSPRR